MTDLLNLALEAHGGLARWRNIAQVRITASFGGTLPWASSGVLAHTVATISTRTAQSSLNPFGAEGHTGHFTTNHAEIRDSDGKVLAEREDPESFYVPDRPWDDLKTVYFAGYALWNYVNIPYLFTWDGFQVAEVEPWQEKEETWRRLRVQFPDYVATHSRVQTFYFGADDGLLRRQDYDVDIRGGVPRAHYTMDHVSVDGFSFPTRRRVVARNPDDTTEAQPVFVSLDVKSISLS